MENNIKTIEYNKEKLIRVWNLKKNLDREVQNLNGNEKILFEILCSQNILSEIVNSDKENTPTHTTTQMGDGEIKPKYTPLNAYMLPVKRANRKTERGFQRYTPEENKTIAELKLNGTSDRQIGKILQRGTRAINEQVYKLRKKGVNI